ncbi:MAG: lytic transglycosylase domain-containing protein [Christensenellales bacterium]
MENKFGIIFSVVLIAMLILLIILTPWIYIKRAYQTKYIDVVKTNIQDINSPNENLNVSFVLSVIKAESGFDENAVSHADAFGLMQITMLTAKDEADRMGIEISRDDLFNPNINIKLGVNYLNYLFEHLQEKQLVLIAYNAGINRLRTWQEEGELKTENGTYICPFVETTNYVKKVLKNEKIYNKILREK